MSHSDSGAVPPACSLRNCPTEDASFHSLSSTESLRRVIQLPSSGARVAGEVESAQCKQSRNNSGIGASSVENLLMLLGGACVRMLNRSATYAAGHVEAAGRRPIRAAALVGLPRLHLRLKTSSEPYSTCPLTSRGFITSDRHIRYHRIAGPPAWVTREGH